MYIVVNFYTYVSFYMALQPQRSGREGPGGGGKGDQALVMLHWGYGTMVTKCRIMQLRQQGTSL